MARPDTAVDGAGAQVASNDRVGRRAYPSSANHRQDQTDNTGSNGSTRFPADSGRKGHFRMDERSHLFREYLFVQRNLSAIQSNCVSNLGSYHAQCWSYLPGIYLIRLPHHVHPSTANPCGPHPVPGWLPDGWCVRFLRPRRLRD